MTFEVLTNSLPAWNLESLRHSDMPQENKKRGRREEKKRKHEADPEGDHLSKRRKSEDLDNEALAQDFQVDGDAGDEFVSFGIKPSLEQTQFYGLLDEEEQAYFTNVNQKISANDFESDEDRTTFVEAVHRELQGKELRIASSQSCSRHLEKIVMLSTPKQLRQLFAAFLADLTYLVQHRFGSHCCETLFLQAAKYVGPGTESAFGEDDDKTTMEDLFLKAVNELEPNIGYLLTERFASHTIRVLLLVLSGEPLEESSMKALLASKRKEKLDSAPGETTNLQLERRKVPRPFKDALSKLIASSVTSLDTTYLRALATHPTGNPVLQLLLRLELTMSDKAKKLRDDALFRKLLPDESLEEDSESARFVSGLLYDPTGSRLIEILVQHTPGKIFKVLYKNVFKPRLGSMVKNDIASYVANKIIERLGKDDLLEAMDVVLPEIPSLLARHRIGSVKVLVERCNVRAVDLQPLAESVQSVYGENKSELLGQMLNIEAGAGKTNSKSKKTEEAETEVPQIRSDVHGSLLAQAMLRAPTTAPIVQEGLLATPTTQLIQFAQDPVASHILQVALTAPEGNFSFRKQFIPRFYSHMDLLATSASGSHLADALWPATNGLQFMKERLALELQNHESTIRESKYGRSVWKNWSMDLYSRRFRDWQAVAKSYKDAPTEPVASMEDGKEQPDKTTKKSAIQLARERHVQKQARVVQQKSSEHKRPKFVSAANA